MRKSEFIDKVARKAEMSRDTAARAVEAIFDTASGTLAEAIRATGNVSLPGFGRFKAKKRAARRGRNPQTGALIDIPERNVIQFTAGPGLQEMLSDPEFTPKQKRGSQAKGGGGAAKKSTAKQGGSGTSGASTPRKSAAKSGAGGGSAARASAAQKSTAKKSSAQKSTAKKSTAKKSGR